MFNQRIIQCRVNFRLHKFSHQQSRNFRTPCCNILNNNKHYVDDTVLFIHCGPLIYMYVGLWNSVQTDFHYAKGSMQQNSKCSSGNALFV